MCWSRFSDMGYGEYINQSGHWWLLDPCCNHWISDLECCSDLFYVLVSLLTVAYKVFVTMLEPDLSWRRDTKGGFMWAVIWSHMWIPVLAFLDAFLGKYNQSSRRLIWVISMSFRHSSLRVLELTWGPRGGKEHRFYYSRCIVWLQRAGWLVPAAVYYPPKAGGSKPIHKGKRTRCGREWNQMLGRLNIMIDQSTL